MAETGPKSRIRDTNGPRAVDVDSPKEKSRGSNRRSRDSDDKTRGRSKRSPNDKSSRSIMDSSSRRKSSTSHSASSPAEKPSFRLDVFRQPSKVVALGVEVETSVIVNLQFSSPEQASHAATHDTGHLMAAASLVADTRTGELVPMEAGSITGQHLFDSLHPIPDEYAESLMQSQPCRIPLGYVTFPELLIRQAGQFRIRITLIQMPGSGSTSPGSTSVMAVDSEVVKVERRQSAQNHHHNQRRHLRVCN